MDEQQPKASKSLTVILLFIIVVLAIIGVILTLIYPNIGSVLSGSSYSTRGIVYDIFYVILTLDSYILYLFGAGIIVFGGLLVMIHFVKIKLYNAFNPSHSTHYLSGYLTLGLNFFIGAEIIRTVAIQKTEEFALLFLVIISRVLLSLILYVEKRWQSSTETE